MPRWVRVLLRLILTVGVGAALFAAVDAEALYEALRGARRPWIAAAVLLLPLNLFLDGWVWARLLDAIEGDFAPIPIGKAVLCGLALGFWTPARLGEYAGRAFAFPEADAWTLSLSVFVQRMADLTVGVVAGLALLAWAFAGEYLPLSVPWITAALAGGGTALVIAVLSMRPSLLERPLKGLGRWTSSLRTRALFVQNLTFSHKRDVFAGSALRYLVFTGQFACLTRALSPSAPLFTIAAAVGLTFYAKYLLPSITLLDLGIREGGAVFFFSVFGLVPAVGLAASLLLFTVNVLLPALLGLPLVSTLSIPWGSSSPVSPAPSPPVSSA